MSLIGCQFWMVLAVALLLAIDSSVSNQFSTEWPKARSRNTRLNTRALRAFTSPLEEPNRPGNPSVAQTERPTIHQTALLRRLPNLLRWHLPIGQF
jgi:hypothetical protein